MNSLVIVALPALDDYIYKISSEKVPHMTILFLGEDATKVKNVGKILDFVGHVTDRSLTRFGLEVDHRGVLGPDLADVLFFSKSKWSGYNNINAFRSYLLKDDNIRTAYDSATQFPEFTPHITLGYPATPAKPDERDYPGISYVNFDRIAVWFGDSTGIEFPLKAYDWDWEMAMSDIDMQAVDEILEHHGIMGMKWGSRSGSSGGSSRSERRINKKLAKSGAKITKKVTKSDKKFEKGASDLKVKIALHNAVFEPMNKHIARINAIPEFKKNLHTGVFLDPTNPISKRYVKAYTDAYVKEINIAATKMGTNPSGTKKYIVARNPNDFLGVTVLSVDVKHDNLNALSFRVKFIKDLKGVITGFEIDDSISQTDLFLDEFLTHHGVMGMKWGVSRGSSRGSESVSVKDNRFGGKKLRTSGGRGHPVHADAVRARGLGQIGKKSGVKALSNAELEIYAKRLNLEANVHRLNYNEKNAGGRFVAKLLGQTGKTAASEVTSSVASHQVKKHLVGRLVKIGAVAATV